MPSLFRAARPCAPALPRGWARRPLPLLFAVACPALAAATTPTQPQPADPAQTTVPQRSDTWTTPPTVAGKPSWTSAPVTVTASADSYAAPNSSAATRTDTPIIKMPQSVQVLTRSLIDEQDRHTLGEALVNVSGVTPTRSDEVLFTPPILRGFPAEVYVDGLAIFAGNQQAYDPNGLVGIERIDVLKGPSATLYGGGLGSPLGGVINLTTDRPYDTLGGSVGLRAGSFWTWNPSADLNVPLAPGINARIAADYQSNNSWIDQVHGHRSSLQPGVAFQLDEATDLLLQGQFNRRGSLEYSGLPADEALAGRLDRAAFPGSPGDQPLTQIDSNMGTATLRHAFSDAVKLTVVGRYYRSTVDESGSFVYPGLFPSDTIAPQYDVFPISMRTRTKELTFDAHLAAKTEMLGGTHEWLGGVSYDRTRFYSGMGLFVSDSPSGTINLADPSYDLRYTAQLPVNSYTDDRYETTAAYVQDQATYEVLHITAGARLTSLKFVERSDFGVANDSTYNHVSPRLGATVDVARGVALFADYATSFRAPFGFIGRQTPKPETSRNIEGGLKLAIPDTHISGTLALFRQTHKNVVTADPANVGFYLQSGRQRARGAETDAVWEPTPAFSLLANYAFTQTRDDGVAPGDTLARVPTRSGRVAARYRILRGSANGLSFGVGMTAFSARELTLPNTLTVPGYGVIDAQASYDLGRFTLGVSVSNLAGRRTWDPYSYMGYPVVAPSEKHSGYVTLKVRL